LTVRRRGRRGRIVGAATAATDTATQLCDTTGGAAGGRGVGSDDVRQRQQRNDQRNVGRL